MGERLTLSLFSDLLQMLRLQICQVLLTSWTEGGLGRGAQGGVCSPESMRSQSPSSHGQAGCKGALEARKVCG